MRQTDQYSQLLSDYCTAEVGDIEELAAVVGGDGQDGFHGAGLEQAAEGLAHGVGGDGGQAGDEDQAGLAFDEHEQAAGAAEAGDDGVHLPMSECGAGGDVGGAVLDGQVLGAFSGLVDGGPGFALFAGMAEGLAVKDADVAVVDVVVDGGAAGDFFVAFDEHVVAGVLRLLPRTRMWCWRALA